MSILTVVIVAALVLTLVTLITGIGSMAHGGEFDEKHSTQFMFARVASQGLTLLLLLLALYLANA